MCGSGTTGKMAHKNGRQFIGVDISADYIKIAKERFQDASKQGALGGL